MIRIQEGNKALALAALFNSSKQQGLGLFDPRGDESNRLVSMTEAQAQELLDAGQTYFDYLYGRVMKVDLSTNEFRPGAYDRDNGQGAALRAVDGLAEEVPEPSP